MKNTNQRGSSLIGALSALAVMGTAGIFFVNLLTNTNNATRHISQSVDWDVLKGNIATLLSNPQACTDSFGGIAVSPTEVAVSLKFGPNTFLAETQSIHGKFMISEMRLKSVSINAPQFLAALRVRMTKMGHSLNAPEREESFFINGRLNGGVIESCALGDGGSILAGPGMAPANAQGSLVPPTNAPTPRFVKVLLPVLADLMNVNGNCNGEICFSASTTKFPGPYQHVGCRGIVNTNHNGYFFRANSGCSRYCQKTPVYEGTATPTFATGFIAECNDLEGEVDWKKHEAYCGCIP